MVGYIVGRVVQAALVLLAVSAFIFALLRFTGDPGATLLPIDASFEQREALRSAYGLDQPLVVQFLFFLGNVVQGNLGVSFSSHEPALSVVLRRLPATFELTFFAMFTSIVIGVPLGVLVAVKKGRSLDHIVTNVAVVAQAMPGFWIGIMLILVFAVNLGMLPTSGRGSPLNLVLPVLTLSLHFVPQVLVLVRSGMLEVLSEPYVQTARAKGLPERRVLFRHALRNVLIPVITIVGLNFGSLLGGAVITESVFAWPGVGLVALQGIYRNDFPVVQCAVLVLASGVVLTNLLVDVLYRWADPRIRLA
jgi:peptide/nickel transport system permease protein